MFEKKNLRGIRRLISAAAAVNQNRVKPTNTKSFADLQIVIVKCVCKDYTQQITALLDQSVVFFLSHIYMLFFPLSIFTLQKHHIVSADSLVFS